MIRVLIADDQAAVRTGMSMMLAAQPDIEVAARVDVEFETSFRGQFRNRSGGPVTGSCCRS